MYSYEKLVDKKSEYFIYTPSALSQKLFLYPTIIGDFIYNPGYHLYRESFDSFLCLYIKKGAVNITTNGITATAHENHIVLLDCYNPHSYSSDVSWEAIWFHFDGVAARDYFNAITQNNNFIFSLKSTYRFEKYITKLYQSFKNCLPQNDAIYNNYIINLLTELLIAKDTSENALSSKDIIEDIVIYIIDNIAEDLSLETLSKRANLSPFYFSRLFKKETGFTPHDYILTTRINHAKYLLTSSSLNIKDICFTLGFNSETSFCTAFKKKVGLTPTDYRTSISLD